MVAIVIIMMLILQVALYEAGKELLEKEFHNLLSHHGKPAPPNVLIELITNDNGIVAPLHYGIYKNINGIANQISILKLF